MTRERWQLCLVVCPAFHGATLLALLLNNHSRVSALGDANPVRQYDQTCACGEHVSKCSFWSTLANSVNASQFERLDTLLPILPWPLERYRLEGREIPISSNARVNWALGAVASGAADAGLRLVWRSGSRPVRTYTSTWLSAYDVVRAMHGTDVVLDASKSVRKARLMARELHDTEVSVVHVVRDPRGFVASWRRHNGSGIEARALAWRWAAIHQRMAALRSHLPYHRVRYEDLAVRPEEEAGRLMDFLRLDRERVVGPPRYPERHHLMGNEMLFSFNGATALDERWREELSSSEQRTVLEASGDLGREFGYA